MKKIYSLISIFSISAAGFLAQTNPATPNAGFENWSSGVDILTTYYYPTGWNCANNQSAILGSVGCIEVTAAAHIHSGLAACQLTTLTIASNLAPGIITTGTIPTSATGSITGGLPYTLRPDSMIGWYQYAPQKVDNGFATFVLFGGTNNADTIAVANFSTPTTAVSAYKRFSAPLVYRSSSPVTLSLWLVCSSNGSSTSVDGSTIYVDDLGLVFNPANSVKEQEVPHFKLGPNPAVDHLEIQNVLNSEAVFILYDITGRKLEESKIENASSVIDLHSFPDGMYMYSLTDEKSKAIQSGKVVIQKQ